MRVFTKIELDTNSKAIICTEDGIEITYEAFPSLPAFKVNGLECVNDRLIANNKPISINGGNQWRPFVHVKDVADSIVKVIKADKKLVNGQIMNLVGENIRIGKIGKIIKSLFPRAKIKLDNNVSDHRDYKASNKKAKKIINFKAKFKITDGIKEIVKQTKKNKIKNLYHKKYINILNYNKF